MKNFFIGVGLVVIFSSICFASYEDAVKLFEEKEYNKSLKILADELVIADDFKPGAPNYNIRFLAAHIHWKLGNIKSATDHLMRCMDIRKKNIDPYIDLTLLQIEQKRYNNAADTARKGIDIEKSAILYYLLGITYLKRKNYWKAKTLFETSNSLNSELYYSYNALGVALMKLKKYSEANTAFLAAHTLKPRSVEILNNLGLSLEKLGKKEKALEYLSKAAEIDNKNQTIMNNISRIKEALND